MSGNYGLSFAICKPKGRVTKCDGLYSFEIVCEQKLQQPPGFRTLSGVDRMKQLGNGVVEMVTRSATARGTGGEWRRTIKRAPGPALPHPQVSRRSTTGLRLQRFKPPRTRFSRSHLRRCGDARGEMAVHSSASRHIGDRSRRADGASNLLRPCRQRTPTQTRHYGSTDIIRTSCCAEKGRRISPPSGSQQYGRCRDDSAAID